MTHNDFNKKIIRSVLIVLVMVLAMAGTVSITHVYADPVEDVVQDKNDKDQDKKDDSSSDDDSSSEVSSSVNTSGFITSAIVSLDNDTKQKELSMDYVKNFSNSMTTALSYDLSLTDPDTIGMHVIGIILYLIEGLGMLISLLVMILYNLASGSFWKATVDNIFTAFNSAIFDWNNVNSWFYRIVVLFGLIAVMKRLFSNMKQTLTVKKIAATVIQVVVSCVMIVFIAQSGRNVITQIDGMVNSSIVQTFDFSKGSIEKNDLPVEVNTKDKIFDILQKQGFLLRHFGVTSVNQIPDSYSKTYKGRDYKRGEGMWLKEMTGSKRAEALLNDPSTDMAKSERQVYGSDQIAYSTNQVAAILGNSLIFFLHRALTAAVIGACCLMLFAFCLLKEVSLYLSVYGLVFQLFKSELRVARNWFFARLKWCILFVFVNLAFNMFLSFILQMINYISSISLLFLLVFDLVLVIAVKYLVNHFDEIWSKITNDLGIDSESSLIDAGKVILNGDIDPRGVYDRRKDRIEQERLESEHGASLDGDDDKISSSLDKTAQDSDISDKEELDDEDKDTEESENEEEDFDVESEFEDIENSDDTDNPDTADKDQDSDVSSIVQETDELSDSEQNEDEKTLINDDEDLNDVEESQDEYVLVNEENETDDLNNKNIASEFDSIKDESDENKETEKMDEETVNDMDKFMDEIMEDENIEDD